MTAPSRTSDIRLGSLTMSRRMVALFAAVTMTLGGVIIAYMVPVVLGLGDARFSNDGDRTVGPVLGLLVAFLGVATIGIPPNSRRKRVSRSMSRLPRRHPNLIVQDVGGVGYHEAEPHFDDDLVVTFTYRRDRPYSVMLGISNVDPHDGSLSTPQVWEVARDVLYEGVVLGVPSGIGDLRVATPNSTVTQVQLMHSDEDCCDGECARYDMNLPRREVRSFLLRSLKAVPEGQESGYLDIDASLDRLLAHGAG